MNLENFEDALRTCTDKHERLHLLCTFSKQRLYSSNLSEAKLFAESANSLAQQLNDDLSLAMVHSLYGSIEINIMNFNNALEHYLQALSIFKKLNLLKETSECLNSISLVYGKLNNLTNAYETLLQALEINPNSPGANSNMGLIYSQKGDFETALSYFLKAKKHFPNSANKSAYISILANISECYRSLGKPDEAFKYLQEAESLVVSDDDIDKYLIYLHYGILTMDTADWDKTESYYLKAKEIALKGNIKEYVYEIELALSDLYHLKKDHEKAYFCLKTYQNLYLKQFNDRFMGQIAKMRSYYEVEKKDMENRQLLEKTAKLSSIGVMAAGITHEINQPLCAIKVNADSILYWLKKNNVDLPHHFSDDLKQISLAAERIDNIIQHIRSFWTLPENRIQKQICLKETTRQAIQLIERQIYSHGIYLTLNFCETECIILAEQIPIEEIIINLVVNAIHSLDEIDSSHKQIVINITKDESNILLSVEDNGTGIDPSLGDKIFDPFYTKKQNDLSMGLGLAIVKQYAVQYNADVYYKNKPEGGVAFYLNFRSS